MFAEDYGETSFRGVGGVFLLGVGSLLLGVVLMIITEILMPDYFRGRTLTKQTRPLVLPETRARHRVATARRGGAAGDRAGRRRPADGPPADGDPPRPR